MTLNCEKIDDKQAVISLSGEFDKKNIILFKNEVLNLISNNIFLIRVNLKNLDYIDAIGIGVFVSSFVTLNKLGGQIILENAQMHINDLIEATQITKYIALTNEEA